MNDEPRNFDDPQLRAAIKRVYPTEIASDALRRRVADILSAESTASKSAPQSAPQTTRRSFWARPLVRLAAAAFLIGLIGLSYKFFTHKESLDDNLVLAMIATHDHCCNAPNHSEPTVPQSNFSDMGIALSTKLHEAVFVPDLAKDGWSSHGGRVCSVGGQPSAHLTFSRGQQRLSVFSVPATACKNPKDGASYNELLNNYVITGIVRSGAVHCLVGQCPAGTLKLQELADLLKKHQSEVKNSSLALLSHP